MSDSTVRQETSRCLAALKSRQDVRAAIGSTSPGRKYWQLGSNLQPLLAQGGIVAQVLGRALEDDAAVSHAIDALRHLQRDRKLLLHQQDGHAALADFGEQVADLLDDLRR